MRERANAWATGDVEALRRSWPRALGIACIGAIMGAGVVQERGYGDMPERVKNAWLAEAERALRENPSTVAVLWLSEILAPTATSPRCATRGTRSKSRISNEGTKVSVPFVNQRLRSKKSRIVFQPWMPVSRKFSAPCLLPG